METFKFVLYRSNSEYTLKFCISNRLVNIATSLLPTTHIFSSCPFPIMMFPRSHPLEYEILT